MAEKSCILCKMKPSDPLHKKYHAERVKQHTEYVRSLYHGKSQPLCEDCGVNTLGDEYYWLTKGVWEESKAKSFLCVGCLEIRLGRELKPDDFDWDNPNCILVNADPWYPKSERLKKRMGKNAQNLNMFAGALKLKRMNFKPF